MNRVLSLQNKALEVDAEFEDRLGLPRVVPLVSRRHEASFYGAMHLLAEHAQVRYFDPDPPFLWLHGVKLPPLPIEPEMLLGFFYHRPHERILVRDEEFQRLLSEQGIHSEAIGMPFVYAMGQQVKRRPGSLLVVPAHSLKNTEHEWPFAQFAEEVAALKPKFQELVACIHPACWEKGYWIKELENLGIRCVRGADSYDRNALRRMAVLFESFETVLTNVWGSHIPYAAACGARVCLYGEYAGYRRADFETAPAYKDRPKVLDKLGAKGREYYVSLLPWLDKAPEAAETQQEWGLQLVGAHHKKNKQELRSLFGWGWRTELVGWWASKKAGSRNE